MAKREIERERDAPIHFARPELGVDQEEIVCAYAGRATPVLYPSFQSHIDASLGGRGVSYL